jgi:hypothetical protein
MGPFPFIAIRSIAIGVPVQARADAFYTHAWGLQVIARFGGIIDLRASGSDHYVPAGRFDQYQRKAAIVRPDRCVYRTAAVLASLEYICRSFHNSIGLPDAAFVP